MTLAREQWQIKRERGLVRYLLWDGIVLKGGPFALLMQIVGYVLLRDGGETFGQYFVQPMTWARFFLQGVLFGIIAGYVNWRVNENTHAAAEKG